MKVKSIRRKITLIGPPNSGKTTIEKVFFEMANPIKLLQKSIEPTKGVNSNRFSLFTWDLGIFDLAGQENEIWFLKESDIFKGSNLIICVFDITSPLESMLHFFKKVLNLMEQIQLYACNLVVLLHKVDLVTPTYSHTVINFLYKQLQLQNLNKRLIPIYETSITKGFFFESYTVFFNIFNEIFNENSIKPSQRDFVNLKVELSIILKVTPSINYYHDDIENYFKLNSKEVRYHLKRLEHMGFIEHPILEPFSFYLTNRAKWFKLGLESEEKKIFENKFNDGLQIIYIFSNLNKVSSNV